MTLKEYMHLKGLSRQDVAAALGITGAYVSMISTGARSPSRKLQVAIDKMIERGLSNAPDDIGLTVTAERTGARELTIKITL